MNKKETGSRQEGPGSDRPQHERQPAQNALHQAGEDVAQSMRQAAKSTRDAATDQVEQQKAAASESLSAFAQAIHQASDELGQRDQTAAARLVNEAANGLENLSRSLSQQNLSEIVDSMREFGRRNPAAFAGGAALAGLALGRLARSSRHRTEGQHAAQGSGTQPSSMPHAASGQPAYGSGDAGEFPASRASTMPAPSVSQSGGSTRPRTGGNPSGGSHG